MIPMLSFFVWDPPDQTLGFEVSARGHYPTLDPGTGQREQRPLVGWMDGTTLSGALR